MYTDTIQILLYIHHKAAQYVFIPQKILRGFYKKKRLLELTSNSKHPTKCSFNLLKPTSYVMHQQFDLLKPTGYVMHQQV